VLRGVKNTLRGEGLTFVRTPRRLARYSVVSAGKFAVAVCTSLQRVEP
jgi:hypothetical protein